MSLRSKWMLGLLAGLLSCAAVAGDDPAHEHRRVRTGDYKALHRSLWFDAQFGDAEKQERLAGLLLGPHGREVGAPRHEGVRFLFRAAVAGRPAAMRHLADALGKGAFGLGKLPAAARCWSSVPAGFEQRLACVRLTGFRDPRARVPCMDLAVTRSSATRDSGNAMARLCLANGTPAILVPGLPPDRQMLDRIDRYKRHGIDWVVTGDVYEADFETFRDAFNKTMSAAIDTERGRGYLERLSNEIDARIDAKYRTSTTGHPQ
ncbi:hypothetical protein [Herbaspirillum sp. SJZ107]|uniref:hypothetical protein n=1 Tax=Herbaspirillum sp. SJZ107 TaxID=2572881 RepID=UPI001154CAE7|nr:hypothetical protein [Herbaspirillum sp. SJZ107]